MRFVLVHGSRHGAWCWKYVVDELSRRGHETEAVDLPGHGERGDEDQTFEGYRDAVVSALRPGDVLVGHSMGCGVSVVAADAFPDIGHLCLLAGMLPVEGGPMIEIAGDLDQFIGTITKNDQSVGLAADGDHLLIDYDNARARYYHDCPGDVARWAYDRLVPQRASVMFTRVSLPRFWAADIPRSYILCTDDRAFLSRDSAQAIRRLGVQPLSIHASHSPFLSCPATLVDTILRAVGTKPVGPLLPTATDPSVV